MLIGTRTRRRLTALVAVLALTGATVVTTAAPAEATALSSQFDPGNIISDANFFNGAAMTATDVQSLLTAKVASCRAGYTCLKDYRETTPSRAATSACTTYSGATSETAAAIVTKVGAACGISQKALLVLLEKEQSLVTDNWPSTGQYRSATGYGCPDTAVCDSQYYGFFNQVYNAAAQFKRYAASPPGWNHIAGRTNAIRYSPNAACGSGSVYIQNQATAGLYNYTPYQPNAAALTNLYGTGDSCSSYGNRNFWRIYSDWFGSPAAGTSLLRTADDATVYITSGTAKYPITNLATLAAYASLGPVGYVAQSYLNKFTTMQPAGRVMRSPSGTIYFTDASIKLPFGSCGLVIDYGGTCDTSGFVQLTDAQLSTFANGPAMGSILGTTAGARFYITSGTKREILDDTSQATAGLPAGFNVLTENAVASLPFGQPIIRDAVFVNQRGSSGVSYLGNGRRYTVTADTANVVNAPARIVGSLSATSLSKIPAAATAFSGVVQGTGSSKPQILTANGSYTWTAGTTSTLAAIAVPAAFLTGFPTLGTITAGSSIKTATSATVYLVMGDKLLPVGSWESLVALAGGKAPSIATVPDAVVNVVPKGPVALTTNTLVRSESNATVYLINGVTSKIAMSNFAYATEAGITGFSYTTQPRIDAYPDAPSLLGFGLTCGTSSYVSAGGSVHPITDAQKPLYPFQFVALDPYTCQLLHVGAPATSFIRTPNGSIYQLSGGQKHPISTMDRFAELNGGAGYLNVVPLFASAIPTGTAA